LSLTEDNSPLTTKSHICEYKLKRAKNIKENNELLWKLFGDGGTWGNVANKGVKKGKKAKSSGGQCVSIFLKSL
jgi:hypothetical protein